MILCTGKENGDTILQRRDFSLKEWLESCEQARDEVEKFRKQQEKGKQSVILP